MQDHTSDQVLARLDQLQLDNAKLARELRRLKRIGAAAAAGLILFFAGGALLDDPIIRTKHIIIQDPQAQNRRIEIRGDVEGCGIFMFDEKNQQRVLLRTAFNAIGLQIDDRRFP